VSQVLNEPVGGGGIKQTQWLGCPTARSGRQEGSRSRHQLNRCQTQFAWENTELAAVTAPHPVHKPGATGNVQVWWCQQRVR